MNDITSTITSKKIQISIGTHTSILNENSLNKIDKDELTKSLRALKAKCKASNVTLKGYNKMLAFIKDNYSTYLNEYTYRQFLFTELRAKAQTMLESSKDGFLDAAMMKLCIDTRNDIHRLHWRSTLLSKFDSLFHSIENYVNVSNYTMINIGR